MNIKKIEILDSPVLSLELDVQEIEADEHEEKEVEQKERENIEEVEESMSETSEDVHGGSEATNDVEDSENPADGGMNEQEGDQSKGSSSKNNEGEEEQEDNGSEDEDGNKQEGEGNGQGKGDGGSGNNDNDQDTCKEKHDADQTESEENNVKNSSDLCAEQKQDKQESNDNEEYEGNEYDENNIEYNEDEQDYEDEDQEEIEFINNKNDNLDKQGGKNANNTFSMQKVINLQKIKNLFFRTLSRLAEDLTSDPMDGDEEWNMQTLMRRSIDKRPLFSCRQEREKEKIVVAIDTSGSCLNWEPFFTSIAELVTEFDLCEILLAPNAEIIAEWNRKTKQYDYSAKKQYRNRTILFFGDFDGSRIMCETSKENRVFWFSNETRYRNFENHSWNSGYTFSDFHGVYFNVLNENEL